MVSRNIREKVIGYNPSLLTEHYQKQIDKLLKKQSEIYSKYKPFVVDFDLLQDIVRCYVGNYDYFYINFDENYLKKRSYYKELIKYDNCNSFYRKKLNDLAIISNKIDVITKYDTFKINKKDYFTYKDINTCLTMYYDISKCKIENDKVIIFID